jgi:hypothetical protein
MSSLLTSILGFVRGIALILFVYVNWPTLSSLVSHEIGWGDAVGTMFTNWGILVLSIVLILTFVISFLKIRAVAWLLNGAVIIVLACLFTGTISVQQVTDTISSQVNANTIEGILKPCGLKAEVEKNGDTVRTVLKNDQGQIVGYVADDDGQNEIRNRIVDLTGQHFSC